MRHKHKHKYKHIEAHTHNINTYIVVANTYGTNDINFRIGQLLQTVGTTSSPSQIQAIILIKAYCKQTQSHTDTYTNTRTHTNAYANVSCLGRISLDVLLQLFVFYLTFASQLEYYTYMITHINGCNSAQQAAITSASISLQH